MTKYSEEFKTKIVREYLDGSVGYETLAVKYDVESKTQIQDWVAVYRRFGAKALAVSQSRKVYSADFKRTVLDYMRETCASYTEAAFRFNITNPATVARWSTALRKGGEAVLEGKRSRR